MWSTSLCHSTTWSASLSLWRNQRSHMKSLSSWMFWKIPYGVVYFQRFYWCPFYLRYLIGFRHLVLKITARTGPLPGRNRVCLHWKKVYGSVWRHWHHKVRHKHASHVTERMHLGIIQYNRTPPGGYLDCNSLRLGMWFIWFMNMHQTGSSVAVKRHGYNLNQRLLIDASLNPEIKALSLASLPVAIETCKRMLQNLHPFKFFFFSSEMFILVDIWTKIKYLYCFYFSTAIGSVEFYKQ